MPSKTRKTKILTLWLTPHIYDALDQVVRTADSDRSKFVRAAIREKLLRSGVAVQTGGAR